MTHTFVKGLLAVTLTALALSACATLQGSNSAGTSGTSKSCQSCERMCEVAGDARENPNAVQKCKADCAKKCG